MVVSKKLEADLLRSRAGLKELWRLHPTEIKRATAAGVAGGAAIGGAELSRHKKDPRGPVASSTIAGAATGQIGYHAAGFAAMRRGRKQQEAGRKNFNGLDRGRQKQVWDDHLKANGVNSGKKLESLPFKQRERIFQNYPKKLPGAGMKRLAANIGVSHTRGLALNAAMTGAGAYIGGEAAHYSTNHKIVEKSDMRNRVFSKGLFRRSQTTSGTKVLEAGAGLGLVGYGVGRSPMIGRALASGIKDAQGKESQAAVEALQVAQSAYGVLGRGAIRGERAARQVKVVNQAIDRVPTAIRPAVAITAGMLLLGHAHPIRRTSYDPVRIRVNTGVTQ
jgi:hypothetical protein